MAAFDQSIKGDSTFYKRYMDDIIRVIKKNNIESTLERINNLHPKLVFKKETENNEVK